MKKLFIITLLLLFIVLINNCGYRLSGYANTIPKYIKTIYIPSFKNKTQRIQAEDFITNAIKKEFIRRTKLKLVNSYYNADAVLEGEIISFETRAISFDQNASSNEYRFSVSLNIKLIDLKYKKPIYEGEKISYSDTYLTDTGDFFSRETEKLIELSEDMASSIVTTILENF